LTDCSAAFIYWGAEYGFNYWQTGKGEYEWRK
jgi:hypothetical protein